MRRLPSTPKHMSSNCLFSVFHVFGRQSGSDSKKCFQPKHPPPSPSWRHVTPAGHIYVLMHLLHFYHNEQVPRGLNRESQAAQHSAWEKKNRCASLYPLQSSSSCWYLLSAAASSQPLFHRGTVSSVRMIFLPTSGQINTSELRVVERPESGKGSLLPMILIKSCFYSGHGDITKYWLAAMAAMLVSVISF